MKTKSSAKKRFKFTATSKIKVGVAFKRHNLRNRSSKVKRQERRTFVMNNCDAKLMKLCMPYYKS